MTYHKTIVNNHKSITTITRIIIVMLFFIPIEKLLLVDINLFFIYNTSINKLKGDITMSINLSSQEAIRKLTLIDLINDAVERNDKEALKWLETESGKKVERRKEDGTTYEVDKSIVSIRAEYIKKFLDYKPASTLSKEAAKARKREKREKERADLFAQAFSKLK